MIKAGIISQSNFLPWRGYFASLRKVETLVFYDTEQYTRRDWRNRNRIWNGNDWEWLSAPVQSKGNYLTPINSMKLLNVEVVPSVISRIKDRYRMYSRTEGFDFVIKMLSDARKFEFLSDINQFTTKRVCEYLKIELEFLNQEIDYKKIDKSLKLIKICQDFRIQNYFTGPSGKNYLDDEEFKKAGVEVSYFDFDDLEHTTDSVEYSIIHHIIVENLEKLLSLTTFRNSLNK